LAKTLQDPVDDERILPDETNRGVLSVHMKRYEFVSELCRNKNVLDVACGVGYGSYYLGSVAGNVTGVDVSPEVIEYARTRYVRDNVSFSAMDACTMTFQNETFDVICSFETIEHLAQTKVYLDEIVRVLRTDGVYIVSTPCVRKTTTEPGNPFHYQEWAPRDFMALLRGYFSSVILYGQIRRQTAVHRLLQKCDVFKLRARLRWPSLLSRLSRSVGTTPFAEMGLEDFDLVKNGFRGAGWMVGVCTLPVKGVRE